MHVSRAAPRRRPDLLLKPHQSDASAICRALTRMHPRHHPPPKTVAPTAFTIHVPADSDLRISIWRSSFSPMLLTDPLIIASPASAASVRLANTRARSTAAADASAVRTKTPFALKAVASS